MQWEDVDAQWHKLTDEVITGMKEWRMHHPKATFREIETELDKRLAVVRARMLADAALLSRATEAENEAAGEVLTCPQCGHRLQARGKQRRSLITHYNQMVPLDREYAVCPECGNGFFPPR